MPDASRKANAEAERLTRAEPQETTTETDRNTRAKPKVTHRAYTVVARHGESDYWVHIGDVTAHLDGGGFTMRLHAVPPDGKIICRRYFPPAENEQ